MSTLLYFLKFLFILLEVLVIFNLIIIVHELGHFLAARWRGLKVEKFGVWFGKPLWQRTYNGVTYSLGSIPAGGFVSLPQLAPMDIIEGAPGADRAALPAASVLDKIIVAFAGPLFSFLFALFFAVVVWGVGKPVSYAEKTTVIGAVMAGSPAEKAGLRAGDKIVAIDGRPVHRFAGNGSGVMWAIARSEGDTIRFDIERDGQPQTVTSGWMLEPRKAWQRAGIRAVGIAPASLPKVKSVEPGFPAEKAGLQAGDIITKVNGQRIYHNEAFSELLKETPNAPVSITFERTEKTGAEGRGQGVAIENTVTVTPTILAEEDGTSRPIVGIAWDTTLTLDHPGPWQQVTESAQAIGRMLDALFSPKSGIRAQHFSGPVGVGSIYYRLLEAPDGWRLALWFSVLFNVNLAILNLLPMPVLDGGHILLAIIEGIRRKPVSLRLLEIVQSACALLLLSFFLYVTFFDIQDLPWVRKLINRGAQTEAVGK